MENANVATALQIVQLIDLKIKEYKRLAAVAGDKFKAESAANWDLRKCKEVVTIRTEINALLELKRKTIINTTLLT